MQLFFSKFESLLVIRIQPLNMAESKTTESISGMVSFRFGNEKRLQFTTNHGEGRSIRLAGIEFREIREEEYKLLSELSQKGSLWYHLGDDSILSPLYAQVAIEKLNAKVGPDPKWSTHEIYDNLVISDEKVKHLNGDEDPEILVHAIDYWPKRNFNEFKKDLMAREYKIVEGFGADIKKYLAGHECDTDEKEEIPAYKMIIAFQMRPKERWLDFAVEKNISWMIYFARECCIERLIETMGPNLHNLRVFTKKGDTYQHAYTLDGMKKLSPNGHVRSLTP